MYLHHLSLAAVLLSLAASASAADFNAAKNQPGNKSRVSLCEPPEVVAFSCAMGKKQLSLCQSDSPGTLIYKFGSNPKAIELQVAGTGRSDSPIVVERTTGWSGGAHQFFFSINVYNQNALYGLDIEEHPAEGEPAGKLMIIASKKVSKLQCKVGSENLDYELLSKLAR